MKFSKWVRSGHRWISVVFVLTVLANIMVMSVRRGEPPPDAVVYAPLLPLALLILTGLYLFALPYVMKRRRSKAETSTTTR